MQNFKGFNMNGNDVSNIPIVAGNNTYLRNKIYKASKPNSIVVLISNSVVDYVTMKKVLIIDKVINQIFVRMGNRILSIENSKQELQKIEDMINNFWILLKQNIPYFQGIENYKFWINFNDSLEYKMILVRRQNSFVFEPKTIAGGALMFALKAIGQHRLTSNHTLNFEQLQKTMFMQDELEKIYLFIRELANKYNIPVTEINKKKKKKLKLRKTISDNVEESNEGFSEQSNETNVPIEQNVNFEQLNEELKAFQ